MGLRSVWESKEPGSIRPLTHMGQVGISILDGIDEAAKDALLRRQRRADDVGDRGDDKSDDAENQHKTVFVPIANRELRVCVSHRPTNQPTN